MDCIGCVHGKNSVRDSRGELLSINAIIGPRWYDIFDRNEKVQIISDISVGSIISSKSKRVLMSFALGVVCALVIIFVLYYVDDTVKNKEKLESLLPIPVLGEIPAHEKKFVKKEKCNVNNRRNATINISRGI